jgi:hypothetical protein
MAVKSLKINKLLSGFRQQPLPEQHYHAEPQIRSEKN